MREELKKKLYIEFPFLYGQHTREMLIEDGWYDILYKMSWRISNYIVTVPSGLSLQDVTVCNVKEKYGRLSVQLNTRIPNTFIRTVQFDAMREAAETCERCGYPGSLRMGGWWQTLCDVCHNAEQRAQ